MKITLIVIVLVLSSSSIVINAQPLILKRRLRRPLAFNRRPLPLEEAERLKLDLEIFELVGKAMLVLPMIFGVGEGTIISTLLG